MTTCVALLRGINVGGHNNLPMQDLRDILAALGCEDVKSYIQSGNAVFHSAEDRSSLSRKIEDAVDKKFGFTPKVLLPTLDDYRSILSANPFPDAVDNPKSLHVAFLSEPATDTDFAALDALKSDTESYKLFANAFYLHAPDGIGRSKLAAKVDRCLGGQTTGRNWRTAIKVADLAESIIS